MNEWLPIGELAVLVSLAGVMIKQTSKNTTVSAQLTLMISYLGDELKELSEQLKGFKDDNKESHSRLWENNRKQDERITEAENRITKLEVTSKGDKYCDE